MTPDEWRVLPDKAAMIRATYWPGCSMAQLAAMIGASRNAVIGVYNRNPGLRTECPPRDKSDNARQVDRDQTGRPKSRCAKRLAQKPQRPVQRVSVPDVPEHRPPLNLPLADMDRGMCKWPMNEGGPYLFCGCATAGTYCGRHERMSVGRGTEGERRAGRFLVREMV